ncbi:MAG: hypothetical protein IKR76_09720 [Ruminococcus sp.]|nr:hypothetical protein [Ruminococcus sp.]
MDNRYIKSIDTEFEKTIWQPFLKAIDDYRLVQNGDNVAVCISGGKDSMLLALLFSMLKSRGLYDIGVTYLCMDPGYTAVNRQKIEQNAAKLGIPAEIFESDIFESVFNIEKSPCYLCARMRRGHLYKNAQDRGCNKIALGHHFDDVIETILMSSLMSGQTRTMMPRLRSENFEGMQLIRPLYLVSERDIISWRDKNGLDFLACACKFTEHISKSEHESDSKRLLIKRLIASLEQDIPNVRENIFKSSEKLDINKLISIKK